MSTETLSNLTGLQTIGFEKLYFIFFFFSLLILFNSPCLLVLSLWVQAQLQQPFLLVFRVFAFFPFLHQEFIAHALRIAQSCQWSDSGPQGPFVYKKVSLMLNIQHCFSYIMAANAPSSICAFLDILYTSTRYSFQTIGCFAT